MPRNPGGTRAAAKGRGEAVIHAVQWALVHGLAMLVLDGQIPIDVGVIDQAVRPR